MEAGGWGGKDGGAHNQEAVVLLLLLRPAKAGCKLPVTVGVNLALLNLQR